MMKKIFGKIFFVLIFFSLALPRANAARVAIPYQYSKDCHVAPDQMGGFMGPVSQTMKLLVDNRFDKEEKKSILAAADTWNKAGLKLFGMTFFQVEFDDIPAAIATATSFACSEHYGGKDFIYLINVEKESQWRALKLEGDQAASTYSPGVTINCHHPVTHELYQEAVLINTNAATLQQFRSVVLHELGHALGLDHSCNSRDPKISEPDYISCRKVGPNDPYYKAVMYPSLKKGDGYYTHPERKESLTNNDLARLQCLYGPR